MRGKEAIDKINAGVNRITPAYAGKSIHVYGGL